VALSAFDEESHPPEPGGLEAVLGQSADLWDQLVTHVAEAYPPITQLWHFAGAKYGWSLRLKRRDRIVLYMTPQPGSFLLGVVLGETAAQAAHDSGLPEPVLALIDGAPRYGEGRGIRLAVSTGDDLAAARTLAALKMAKRSTAKSIDEYIAGFPPETQKVLEELRALIKAGAPEATETISYAIPTFDLNGHHLVHFAGYEKHVGFYPTGSGVEAFREELKPYKSGKGSVQFPLGRPLPTDLIRRIVGLRVAENTDRG
jgi:uncharacterized protein YdhG (YjbR/CyaY superfamily)